MQNLFRDLEFAGNFCLAESAPRYFHPVFLLFCRPRMPVEVVGAFIFVVPFGRDGAGRAAGCAGFTGLLEVVKAVEIMMGILLA